MAPNSILLVSSLSGAAGLSSLLTSNNVMYAYIDRKKKLPVTTLLRAIGLESDKDIIQIFDLAEEIKVTKSNLKAAIGRRLAGRIVKSWVEDYSDQATGEVVSIERNDVIVDRGTELSEDNIDAILDSGTSTLLLEKENVSAVDYSIIFNTLQKITPTPKRRLFNISIGSSATQSHRTMRQHARLSRIFSSQRRDMTSARWAASESTRSLISTFPTMSKC